MKLSDYLFENSKPEYLGTCIDTVDDLQFWDATEMAQMIENSTPLTKQKFEKIINIPKGIKMDEFGVGEFNGDTIYFGYNNKKDIHYFWRFNH